MGGRLADSRRRLPQGGLGVFGVRAQDLVVADGLLLEALVVAVCCDLGGNLIICRRLLDQVVFSFFFIGWFLLGPFFFSRLFLCFGFHRGGFL